MKVPYKYLRLMVLIKWFHKTVLSVVALFLVVTLVCCGRAEDVQHADFAEEVTEEDVDEITYPQIDLANQIESLESIIDNPDATDEEVEEAEEELEEVLEEGETPTDDPEISEEDLVPGADDDDVICHKPGMDAEQTLYPSENSIQAHLDHGDITGECTD